MFTEPGQSITYNFFVLNQGAYDAFLTNVNFNEVESEKVTKKCVGESGVSKDLLEKTCNDIVFEIKVRDVKTNISKQLSNHKLLKGEYKPVTVTISYPIDASRVDGNMGITFSDIKLIYNTQDHAIDIPTNAVTSSYTIDEEEKYRVNYSDNIIEYS